MKIIPQLPESWHIFMMLAGPRVAFDLQSPGQWCLAWPLMEHYFPTHFKQKYCHIARRGKTGMVEREFLVKTGYHFPRHLRQSHKLLREEKRAAQPQVTLSRYRSGNMNNAEKVLSRHGLIEMTQERFPFTKRWRDSELVRRIVWFPDDSAEHADDVFPYKERMFFSSLWKLGAKGIYWNTFHFLTQGIYALRRVICKYDDYCGFNNIARAYNFAIDNPRHFISFLDGVEYTGEIRTQMEIPELPSPHVGVLLRNDAWAKKYRQTLLEGIETVPNEPVNEITRQISLFGEEAEEIYAKALSSQ